MAPVTGLHAETLSLSELPEDEILGLPSDVEIVSSPTLSAAPEMLSLAAVEAPLRFAQAMDLIAALRRQLCYMVHVEKWRLDCRGQQENTRSRTTVASVQGKLDTIQESYNRYREAFLRLVGSDAHHGTLRELKSGDVRPLHAHQHELNHQTGPREGHRLISWIWTTSQNSALLIQSPGSQEDLASQEMQEGMFNSARNKVKINAD
jgi:hypothetical protein